MATEESEAASFRFAWSRAKEVTGSYGGTSSEVMPPEYEPESHRAWRLGSARRPETSPVELPGRGSSRLAGASDPDRSAGVHGTSGLRGDAGGQHPLRRVDH